jgi:glycosyltransferase involved in cell wall biosynthesis
MQKLKPILSNGELIDKTRVIYDAEAIFAVREVQRRRLAGEEVSESEVDILVRDEIQLAFGVNSIISVSKSESKKFKEYGFNQVYTLGHSLSIKSTQNHFSARSNILFVGAIHADNAPNADSVFWFVKEVLPKIKKQLNGNVNFMIVGFNTSEKILVLEKENDNVQVFGQVNDLQKFYNQSKIFVVPARFAAGIPLKLLDAAANGLPIVCTSLIASQVDWEDDIDLLVADEPTTFAEQCVKLYTQPQLWEKIRNNALRRVKLECSEDSFTSQLKDILK